MVTASSLINHTLDDLEMEAYIMDELAQAALQQLPSEQEVHAAMPCYLMMTSLSQTLITIFLTNHWIIPYLLATLIHAP